MRSSLVPLLALLALISLLACGGRTTSVAGAGGGAGPGSGAASGSSGGGVGGTGGGEETDSGPCGNSKSPWCPSSGCGGAFAICDNGMWVCTPALPCPILPDAGVDDATAFEDVSPPLDSAVLDAPPPQDSGPTACGNLTCAAGAVCVQTASGGGPCLEPEGGTCPPNTILQGGCCVFSETTYACKPAPGPCSNGSTAACGCAALLCPAADQGCGCQGFVDNVVQCVCAFP